MSKMRYLEKKFKDAEDYLRNTGEGLTSNDEKLGITNIREKVISICPFYFQVKPFMSENVAVNPPYVAETGMNENIEEMLFGTSRGPRFYESLVEEGEGNFEEGNVSGNEEAEFEGEAFTQHEPTPEPPSQGTPPLYLMQCNQVLQADSKARRKKNQNQSGSLYFIFKN